VREAQKRGDLIGVRISIMDDAEQDPWAIRHVSRSPVGVLPANRINIVTPTEETAKQLDPLFRLPEYGLGNLGRYAYGLKGLSNPTCGLNLRNSYTTFD
jgi:hypothetical protein